MYKKRVGIASVIILAVGLLSGVILVQQSQELREKAAESDPKLPFAQETYHTYDVRSLGSGVENFDGVLIPYGD